MQIVLPATGVQQANERARRRLLSLRGEPLFLADWDRATFIHYEVNAEALQKDVPYGLDLCEGRAFVSVVAFTMRRMRIRFGGRLGEWVCKPIATHEFLNVRTYVRYRGEPGIYFLAEWLSNPMAVRLGPRTFGLPYRLGEINYHHRHEAGTINGTVQLAGRTTGLRYSAELGPDPVFGSCPEGSMDEFLLERYTALTSCGSKHRFFRIWHPPWEQVRADIAVHDDGLLVETWPWFKEAKRAGGNYSPGTRDVWMGWPHRINNPRHRSKRQVFFEMP